MEFYSDNKPEKCPQCGSMRIVTFLYGYTGYSEELMNAIKNGEIVLGGSRIEGFDPDWECNDCKTEIFKKNTNA